MSFLSDHEKRRQLREQWWAIQNKLLKVLLNAAKNCTDLSEKSKIEWSISTTHREVDHVLKYLKQTTTGSACIVRKIREFQDASQMIPHDKVVPRFVDLDNDGVGIDKDNQVTLFELVKQMKDLKVPTHTFEINWDSRGILEDTHAEYMKEMANSTQLQLLNEIKHSIDSKPVLDRCVEEASTHLTFGGNRASTFYGRNDLIEKGMKYFKNSHGGQKLCVIHGISGSIQPNIIKEEMSEKKCLYLNSYYVRLAIFIMLHDLCRRDCHDLRPYRIAIYRKMFFVM